MRVHIRPHLNFVNIIFQSQMRSSKMTVLMFAILVTHEKKMFIWHTVNQLLGYLWGIAENTMKKDYNSLVHIFNNACVRQIKSRIFLSHNHNFVIVGHHYGCNYDHLPTVYKSAKMFSTSHFLMFLMKSKEHVFENFQTYPTYYFTYCAIR